jgi:hypothetical protein
VAEEELERVLDDEPGWVGMIRVEPFDVLVEDGD